MKLAESYPVGDKWYLEAIGIGAKGKETAFFQALTEKYGKEANKWPQPMIDLSWRLHPPESAEAWYKLAMKAKKVSLENRKKALDALAFIQEKQAALLMLKVAQEGPEDLKALAKYWLIHRKNNDWQVWADELPVQTNLKSAYLSAATLETLNQPAQSSNFKAKDIIGLDGDAENGKRLVDQRCKSCHMIQGKGAVYRA